MARNDFLTGLMHRDAFLRELKETRWSSGGVLLADLHGLGRVNLAYGYAIGDQCLCRAAQALCQSAGACAAIYRIGGDEFALLDPALGELELEQLAEQVKGRFLSFDAEYGAGLSISLAWAAVQPGQDSDMNGAFCRAWECLKQTQK